VKIAVWERAWWADAGRRWRHSATVTVVPRPDATLARTAPDEARTRRTSPRGRSTIPRWSWRPSMAHVQAELIINATGGECRSQRWRSPAPPTWTASHPRCGQHPGLLQRLPPSLSWSTRQPCGTDPAGLSAARVVKSSTHELQVMVDPAACRRARGVRLRDDSPQGDVAELLNELGWPPAQSGTSAASPRARAEMILPLWLSIMRKLAAESSTSPSPGLRRKPASWWSGRRAARVTHPRGEARERILDTASASSTLTACAALGRHDHRRVRRRQATFYRHFPSKDDLAVAYSTASMPGGAGSSKLRRGGRLITGRLVGMFDACSRSAAGRLPRLRLHQHAAESAPDSPLHARSVEHKARCASGCATPRRGRCA